MAFLLYYLKNCPIHYKFSDIAVFKLFLRQSSAPQPTTREIPPPERLGPVEGVDEHSATAPGKCPLCLQARVNSTACLTSGYVFCYLCIISYVQTSHKCPVTYAPTDVDDLVRVYDIS